MSKTAKPKFQLDPSPTFVANVEIPTHGGNLAEVGFTFKHRTRDEMFAFRDSLKTPEAVDDEEVKPGPTDVEVIMSVASGWDLDEPFDVKSVTKLVQNYIAAPIAILTAYYAELSGARTKN